MSAAASRRRAGALLKQLPFDIIAEHLPKENAAALASSTKVTRGDLSMYNPTRVRRKSGATSPSPVVVFLDSKGRFVFSENFDENNPGLWSNVPENTNLHAIVPCGDWVEVKSHPVKTAADYNDWRHTLGKLVEPQMDGIVIFAREALQAMLRKKQLRTVFQTDDEVAMYRRRPTTSRNAELVESRWDQMSNAEGMEKKDTRKFVRDMIIRIDEWLSSRRTRN